MSGYIIPGTNWVVVGGHARSSEDPLVRAAMREMMLPPSTVSDILAPPRPTPKEGWSRRHAKALTVAALLVAVAMGCLFKVLENRISNGDNIHHIGPAPIHRRFIPDR